MWRFAKRPRSKVSGAAKIAHMLCNSFVPTMEGDKHMIEIAEVLPPNPTPLWKLAKQAGVDWVVGGLPFNDPTNANDGPCDYLPLLRMKQRYESAGFKLGVIEA